MQKRVYNAIRAVAEKEHNSIISIHDHGAGGHLNCLSELVEEVGGDIDISKLPVGDPTLSDKEIIGNESQERMGLVMKKATRQSSVGLRKGKGLRSTSSEKSAARAISPSGTARPGRHP